MVIFKLNDIGMTADPDTRVPIDLLDFHNLKQLELRFHKH